MSKNRTFFNPLNTQIQYKQQYIQSLNCA